MKIGRGLAAGFVWGGLSLALAAQIPQVAFLTQAPAPGSGHDYIRGLVDTVNPANGQLSLRFGVPLPWGRGLALPFGVDYSSSGVFFPAPEGMGSPGYANPKTPASGWYSSDGWMYSLPRVSNDGGTATDDYGGTCNYTNDYVFYDPSGGATNLSVGRATEGTSINTDYPCSSTGMSTVTQAQNGPWFTDLDAGTVTGVDGTVYNIGGNGGLPPGVVARDRNGNEVSMTGGSNGQFSYLDTLGRTVLAVSGFDNPNTNQVDTLAVSGLSQPYRLVWRQVSYSFSSSFDLLGTDAQCSQGPVGTSGTLDAVSEVDLPNGQSFQISYAAPSGASSYATITKITTPGGATISYTWGIEADADYASLNWQGADPNATSGPTYWNFSCEYHYGAPVVTDRSVSLDGTHEILHQHFDYSVNWGSGAGQWSSRQTTETDTITNPDGSTRTRQIVYRYAPGGFADPRTPNSTTAVGSSPAAESSVEYFEGGAGSPERTVSKTWFNGDVRELGSETVSLNGEPVSMTARCYDANYQLVDVDEYGGANDGSGATSLPDCAVNQSMPTPPGPLLRQTVTSYAAASSSALAAAHIDDVPSSRIVCNGGRQPVAATDFSYDGTSVVTSGATVGRDASYNGNTAVARGNLTAQTRWTTVSGSVCTAAGASKSGALTSSYTWDDAGQPLSFTDPGQHTTRYTWGDAAGSPGGTDGFLLQVTDAAGFVNSYGWDYASGHLLTHTGQNGEVTSYQYSDPLGRLTQITDPAVPVNGGGTDNPVTKVSYGDTPGDLYTEIQRKIDSSTWTDEYTLYDGLGRAVSHSRVDPDNGWDRSDTGYDGLGRVAFRSYPCPATSPTGAAVCAAGDTFAYDALGRPTAITHADNTQISYTYQGAATEVEDEGNGSYRVTHVYQHDGLGRLASVCEANGESGAGTNSNPIACSGQISGFAQDLNLSGFETGYGYDALGDLTKVQQTGLDDRSFTYDSLGRLLSASNPETGTVRYAWDDDPACPAVEQQAGLPVWQAAPGELMSRTDARGVRACYQYDGLNRRLSRGYSDGTPAASFIYDWSSAAGLSLSNTVGRLALERTTNASGTILSEDIFSYDPLGRVTSNWQDPGNGPLEELDSGYDLVGERTGESSGAGMTFTASYNRAGRLSGLGSSAGPATLFSGATWFAFGGLHTATLGSGVQETRGYDGRQRLTTLSDQAPLAQYTLNYTLGLGWAPDGALASAQDVVNGGWSYRYDALNRPVDATCSGTPSAPCAGEANRLELTWSYDRQGNRWTQAVAAGTGTAASASFSGGNNRMDATSYDAAGNLLSDGTHTYTWDAEERLVAVDGGATASYGYDAFGRRVRRTANGTTVDDLLGPDGGVRSEYDESRQAWARTEITAGGRALGSYNPQTGATTLNIADELGTLRARTDLAGNVQERYTSLPFGDLLTTWDDNWQPTSPEVGAISPLHFTGKPRDEETGLDDFGARLYSSSLGRWMTPDWAAQAEPVPYAKFTDPQSLNLYTYSVNTPVSKTDADGHFPLLGLVGIGVAVGEVATHGAELYYKSQDDAALIRWEQADEKMLNDALYSPGSKIDTDNLIKEINQLRAELGWALLDTGQTIEQVLEPISKAPTATVTQEGATVERDIGVIVDTSTKASVSVTQKIGSPGKGNKSQTQQPGPLPLPQPQPKRCDKPGGQDCQ